MRAATVGFEKERESYGGEASILNLESVNETGGRRGPRSLSGALGLSPRLSLSLSLSPSLSLFPFLTCGIVV